jgi:hypothetical protein
MLLATSALIIVAPKFRSIALAIRDKNPKSIAIQIDETTPNGRVDIDITRTVTGWIHSDFL